MTTPWKPIVVGVDASAAAADAAVVGGAIAGRAGVPVRLVHALPEVWTVPSVPHAPAQEPEIVNRAAREAARVAVSAELEGIVGESVEGMLLRTGRAAAVIPEVVGELDAGLVVVGGKRHSAVDRWFAGSTAHVLARTLDVPLLVTGGGRRPIERVLVAIDLSDAAERTVRYAEHVAALFAADVHIIHLVEPVPIVPETPLQYDDAALLDQARAYLEREVWPRVEARGATTAVRRGSAVDGILAEAAACDADVVVVGSHGKGWVDRILIGSVTERVLSALPASVLVVPVVGPTGGRSRRATRGRLHLEV